MHDLATNLREAQLYAHNAHNLAKGPSFFSDHAFFGDAYAAYEKAYDDLVEQMIGLGYSVDLPAIAKTAGKEAGAYSFDGMTNEACFRVLLQHEQEIQELVKKYVPHVDDGTQNMLQGFAQDSLHRCYLIKRRLA